MFHFAFLYFSTIGNGPTIHMAYVQLFSLYNVLHVLNSKNIYIYMCVCIYIARTTSGGKLNYKQYNTIMNRNLLDVCLLLYISINLYFFFL